MPREVGRRLKPWQQGVLGVVQGVAEVAPVSSSAQLTLLPWLLRWPTVGDRTAFAAGLHAGSTAGLLVSLRGHLRDLPLGQVALATVPAAVAGLVGQDAVERRLGRPGTTAALMVGAAGLLWAADRRPETGRLDGAALALAGAAQVAALAPGVSRHGAALTALRWRGVPREEAVRASLLLSLPVTTGAAGLTAVRARALPPAVPTALAAVAAAATVTRASRQPGTLVRASGVYRLGVAALVAARLRREQR